MSAYILLRTLKTLALLGLAAGVSTSVSNADARTRRHAVDRLALPSLFVVWTAGYALAKWTERSLGSPAITVAMLASLLTVVLLDRDSAARVPRAALVASLAAATVAMHLRDTAFVVLGASIAAALIGAACTLVLPPRAAGEPDPDAALARFRGFAMVETVTTAMLFLVDMPLRYGVGIRLDGGLGLFGWVHGAAVLGYLTITLNNHRALGGSWSATAGRLLAGIVPFASLWVLHRTARSTSGTPSTA